MSAGFTNLNSFFFFLRARILKKVRHIAAKDRRSESPKGTVDKLIELFEDDPLLTVV